MRKFIWILFFSAIASPAFAADDNLIIPGERVGPITADTTEDELKALFPGAEIKRMFSSMPPDGGYACVTVVYPKTDKQLEIFWSNEQSFDYSEVSDKINRNPSSEESQKLCESLPSFKNAEYVFPGAAWHTKEGLNSGMSLKELENINGAPLTIDASESCFGGGINEWHNGKISEEILDNIRMAFHTGDFSWEGRSYEPGGGSVLSTAVPDEIKNNTTLSFFEISLIKNTYAETREFRTTLEGYELTCQEKVNVFTKDKDEWRQVFRDLPHKGMYYRDDQFVGYGMCDYVVCQPLAKPYKVPLVEYREVGKRPIPSEDAESYTVKNVTAYESVPLKGEIKIDIDYFSDDKCKKPKQFSTIINQP